jgi:hypothetical protein
VPRIRSQRQIRIDSAKYRSALCVASHNMRQKLADDAKQDTHSLPRRHPGMQSLANDRASETVKGARERAGESRRLVGPHEPRNSEPVRLARQEGEAGHPAYPIEGAGAILPNDPLPGAVSRSA